MCYQPFNLPKNLAHVSVFIISVIILLEIPNLYLPLLPDEVAIGAGGNVVTGGGVEPYN